MAQEATTTAVVETSQRGRRLPRIGVRVPEAGTEGRKGGLHLRGGEREKVDERVRLRASGCVGDR